jgi:hypothetical protein
VAKTLVLGATFLDFIFFFRVCLSWRSACDERRSITPRDELCLVKHKKENKFSFEKDSKTKERERIEWLCSLNLVRGNLRD